MGTNPCGTGVENDVVKVNSIWIDPADTQYRVVSLTTHEILLEDLKTRLQLTEARFFFIRVYREQENVQKTSDTLRQMKRVKPNKK